MILPLDMIITIKKQINMETIKITKYIVYILLGMFITLGQFGIFGDIVNAITTILVVLVGGGWLYRILKEDLKKAIK